MKKERKKGKEERKDERKKMMEIIKERMKEKKKYILRFKQKRGKKIQNISRGWALLVLQVGGKNER